ncbi:integrase [Methylocystis sp. JR02]|uniref:integrase n=1 Tax=Methylocystis sp. JR02 TaxID=3046284 RepID=UPI0024BBD552|nr:integrase [Methylocystis sp. JR02]MDJ0448600.1 integrase [Methylocystis sp. JR02]
MSLMISEVYDAFVAAGTPEDKARKAAEALTGHEGRFTKIETEIVAIRGELALLKWMLGFGLALLTAIALKLFLH